MIGWPLEHYLTAFTLPFWLGFLLAFVPVLSKVRRTQGILLLIILGSFVSVAGAVYYWRQPMDMGVTITSRSWLEGLPSIAVSVYLDPLAVFFLVLSGAGIGLVAVYSWGWLANVQEAQRIAGGFSLLAWFTLMIPLLNNVYTFLLALEGVTLTFAYLVLYRHDKVLNDAQEASRIIVDEARLAFRTYLIFSHIGMMLITVALMILSVYADNFDFDALRTPGAIPSGVLNLVFLTALAGFGIKAGMTPAHVWVSIVHPQSPTNIHAMVSGIILKVTGLYGMIRVFFEFLPSISWWWGWLVLLLAGATALAGVFYALVSHDLKTTLASHSVENIGIILAGLGLALLFRSKEFAVQPVFEGLAGLALLASLYHTLNHALFKGLLFLCTGAIEDRMGTVEFDRLDGLMNYFPWTATTFLVGAVSIAGFPPFNGFISEWLTLQTLFAGMDLFSTAQSIPLLMGLILALLMLGSAIGLTALAFVKVAGETLLGPPRQPGIMAHARQGDVPWTMRGVLVILAGMCLITGIFPAQTASLIEEAVQAVGLETAYLSSDGVGLLLEVPVEPMEVSSDLYVTRVSGRLLLAVLLLGGVSVALGVAAWRKHRRRGTAVPVWVGGVPYQPQKMEMTGGVLTALVWQPLARRKELRLEESETPFPYQLEISASAYVNEYVRQVYNAFLTRLLRGTAWFGEVFQNGQIGQYFLYIFVTLILILLVLFFPEAGGGQ